jgi:hypothetical protein
MTVVETEQRVRIGRLYTLCAKAAEDEGKHIIAWPLYLTVRPFSKWFVRNGAKPCIYSRREAQQL